MKLLYYIIALFVLWMFSLPSSAQESSRRRQQQSQNNSGLPELSVRAASKNDDQTQNIDNVVWLKEIYRWIDLTKEENAPLYYPINPIGNRMNFFTMVFKLMSEGKVKAYEVLDGREIFTEKYEANFEEYVLKRFNILYTSEKRGTQTIYTIDESDIPSAQVTLFLIKEAWYFNQANGTFDKKILAICPMLVEEDYEFGGGSTRSTMFWLPYENIRPYIAQSPIMTSNVNNALTYTVDDFFRKNMYEGEIVKTTNLMNRTLAQQYGDSAQALKHAQDSIEAQLKFFEEQLWVKIDSSLITNNKKKSKKDKDTVSSSDSTATSTSSNKRGNSSQKQKATKTKAPKAEKSSTPTKSVRRTR